MTKLNQKVVEHLSKDKILLKLINDHVLPVRKKHKNLFLSLLGSIISQQLSTKAAATIMERFLSLFEDKNPIPESVLETDTEKFRAVGLSYQKAGYVKNIAAYFLNHHVDGSHLRKMSDEEIISELTQIKGVGEWTVQMTLMFTMNRKDVLPLKDLIIKNSIVKYYNITEQGKEQLIQIEKITSKWKPFRSIACYYLWAAKDNIK